MWTARHARCLAFVALVMGYSATPIVADSQTPADRDSLLVVLRWGAFGADSTGPWPAQEVRWVWNGQIVREDTVARLVDSVMVPAPTPGVPDTLVTLLWPVSDGPPTLRRMRILDARLLKQEHGGVMPAVLTLDERRGQALPPSATGTSRTPGDADLDFNEPDGGTTWTFDSPTDGATGCGGGACPWETGGGSPECRVSTPPQAIGCYRTHYYDPGAGVNGSGAIVMHWETGMQIGYSPVFLEGAGNCTNHFTLRYAVRQTTTMLSEGSAQKVLRLRCGGTFIGTMISKPNTWPGASGPRGQIVWHWDHTGVGGSMRLRGNQTTHPADNQWHIYQLEIDYRGDPLRVVLTIDGQQFDPNTETARGLPSLSGTFDISPFNEMYSCGQHGCSNRINTGGYTVDDVSYTVLP